MNRKVMVQIILKYRLGIGILLIFIVTFCALLLIFSTPVYSLNTQPLAPLDEAALKHSPGNLISENLKKSEQFLFLNELLMIDELILKQLKFKDAFGDGKDPSKEECDCCDVPDPSELICEQVKVLLKKKEEIASRLVKATEDTKFSELEDIDLLIELEIVDDLIIVQPQVKDALVELMRLCRFKSFNEIKRLLKLQMEVLLRKKEFILKGLYITSKVILIYQKLQLENFKNINEIYLVFMLILLLYYNNREMVDDRGDT